MWIENYRWIATGVAVLVLLAVMVGILVSFYRKRAAEKKVAQRTDEEKLRDFQAALNPAGFDYTIWGDYVFSQKNPWQKRMGYTRFYDEAAGTMNMIIDCEPVTFYYDNHYWLIEFWKGQYGMATGAEIGIYIAETESEQKPDYYEGTIFHSVNERDYMDMEFVLYRNDKKLLWRSERHWWLTAFKPGIFSQPDMLQMECRLRFPNFIMLSAFVEGMKKCGYTKEELQIRKNVVSFVYSTPKSSQPFIKKHLGKKIQRQNRRNCACYMRLTQKYERTLDKVDYIRYRLPGMFRKLTAIGRMRMRVGIKN